MSESVGPFLDFFFGLLCWLRGSTPCTGAVIFGAPGPPPPPSERLPDLLRGLFEARDDVDLRPL